MWLQLVHFAKSRFFFISQNPDFINLVKNVDFAKSRFFYFVESRFFIISQNPYFAISQNRVSRFHWSKPNLALRYVLGPWRFQLKKWIKRQVLIKKSIIALILVKYCLNRWSSWQQRNIYI